MNDKAVTTQMIRVDGVWLTLEQYRNLNLKREKRMAAITAVVFLGVMALTIFFLSWAVCPAGY